MLFLIDSAVEVYLRDCFFGLDDVFELVDLFQSWKCRMGSFVHEDFWVLLFNGLLLLLLFDGSNHNCDSISFTVLGLARTQFKDAA